jgi:hypothetical protein
VETTVSGLFIDKDNHFFLYTTITGCTWQYILYQDTKPNFPHFVWIKRNGCTTLGPELVNFAYSLQHQPTPSATPQTQSRAPTPLLITMSDTKNTPVKASMHKPQFGQ